MTHARILLCGAIVLAGLVSPVGAQSPASGSVRQAASVIPCQTDAVCCPAGSTADDSAVWTVLGGGSLYLLKPYTDNNIAFRTTTTIADPGTGTATSFGQTNTTPFDWDVEPACAFWLGVVSPSGLGLRSRYFHFNASSSSTGAILTPAQAASPFGVVPATSTFISPSPFVPDFLPGALPPAAGGQNSFGSPGILLQLLAPNGDTGIGEDRLTFSSDLTIDTVDIESTFAWTAGSWRILAGAGGRYLHLAQNYRATLFNTGGGLPISEKQTLEIGRNFNGVGPMLSGQLSWDIGSTGLAVFGAARGSLLVGQSNQLTTFTQELNDPTGLSGVVGLPNSLRIGSQIPSSTDAVLPVAEFEVGLEYALTAWDNLWFFRGALVSQTYFDAGNASRADGNLSLFGAQMSVGLNY